MIELSLDFTEFNTLYVGFSGGLDSTVLLHRLAQEPALVSRLCGVHVHHGLSPQANLWQEKAQSFCEALNISFKAYAVLIARSGNLEEAARNARYDVFSSLLKTNDAFILAHHADDQAETVLLQLFRGAGIDGLAAMAPVSSLAKGTLLRPLLHLTRAQLHAYAEAHALTWVDDESNQDITFSRNYLRHQVMPIIKAKWPGVVSTLDRAATLCQQAKTNLETLGMIDGGLSSVTRDVLPLDPLKTLTPARLSNVLRTWIKQHQVRPPSAHLFHRLIHEVILARPDATPMITWDNVIIRRYKNSLYWCEAAEPKTGFSLEWPDFPSPLLLPELGTLTVSSAASGLQIPFGATVQVRFRSGGETITLHGQTKQLKTLCQAWKIPPWQRDQIPLVYVNNILAVIVGHAVSDHFYSDAPDAVNIAISHELDCMRQAPNEYHQLL